MAKLTVCNTTASPVTVDDDGRQVGGGEWASLDDSAPRVADALSAGRLVAVATVGADANPEAALAADATEAASSNPEPPRSETVSDTEHAATVEGN